jgi:hypothetical protein
VIFTGLTADCLPPLDKSDRPEPADQVEVIVVLADGAMIYERPGEQVCRINQNTRNESAFVT